MSRLNRKDLKRVHEGRPASTLIGIALGMVLLTGILEGCSKSKSAPELKGSVPRARLMSGKQYSTTIAYLFGADISDSVPAPLPPLVRTSGLLASGAATIGVTSDQLQQIQLAAETIAAKVVDEDHRSFLIPCRPVSEKAADPSCATTFLARTGRLWFRRPLPPARVAAYVAQASTAADQLHDFYAGMGLALEGMLVSPEALFIVDGTEPDPERPGRRRLDSYALASRLSYFLWNAAPDDELLKAAESGGLYNREGRERAVNAMLASSRLEEGMRAFFDDMMGFNDFDSLAKDAKKYPSVTGATLADAREQTLRTVIDHLLTRDQDYRNLFTTRATFMSLNLAAVYGVPAMDGWAPYEFPADSPRAGLLTQVSFLAAHAHPARSSVTRRGKALREVFLCQVVPTPPPNVDFSKLNDPDPSLKTARDRLKVHATNASCAGCHKIMDPIGYALEHLIDDNQHMRAITSAILQSAGIKKVREAADGSTGLEILRDHPAVPACLVNRVYSYGVGGPLSVREDKATLEYFKGQFAKAGFRLPELLRDIALSEAFVRVRSIPKHPRATVRTVALPPVPLAPANN